MTNQCSDDCLKLDLSKDFSNIQLLTIGDMNAVLSSELCSLFREQSYLYEIGSPDDIAEFHKQMSFCQVLINDLNALPVRHAQLRDDIIKRRKKLRGIDE
jgi:hypothetical protein